MAWRTFGSFSAGWPSPSSSAARVHGQLAEVRPGCRRCGAMSPSGSRVVKIWAGISSTASSSPALRASYWADGVGEDAEDDLVHGRLLAVPVGVLGHPDELALPDLGDRERARPHAVLPVVLVDRLGVVLLVDVLRDDVDVHDRQLGIRHRAGDLDRPLVDDLGVEVGGRADVVDPLLVTGAVDRVGDVLGGQRLAVAPLQAFPQRVGHGEAVVADLPGLGQPGR